MKKKKQYTVGDQDMGQIKPSLMGKAILGPQEKFALWRKMAINFATEARNSICVKKSIMNINDGYFGLDCTSPHQTT